MAGYGELYGGTFAADYGGIDTQYRNSSATVKSGAMGAVSGAATGASAGASVGGPVGAIIGGIVGAIGGGILGGLSGSNKAKAKAYQRLAQRVQQQREANKDYNTFLQMIRQQRLARASTLAEAVATGTEMTSKTAGTVSGQQAQTAYGIQYLAEDRRLQSIYESYMRSAGKKASLAQDAGAALDTFLTIGRAISTVGSLGSSTGTQTTSTLPEGVEISPGATSYVSGTFTMNPVIGYYP